MSVFALPACPIVTGSLVMARHLMPFFAVVIILCVVAKVMTAGAMVSRTMAMCRSTILLVTDMMFIVVVVVMCALLMRRWIDGQRRSDIRRWAV